ncbi:MAG TPA: SMP-30/gluconolactonase/LRE family protein [Chloroflexota bacterium]|nr:SMP-30/gluconolactonase/LRE family protein [Chloroflexota bacterium]
MAWTFERATGSSNFTEGPVWTGEALLFTETRDSRIMRYSPHDGSYTEFAKDTVEANGLTLDRQGRLYVCEGGGRRVARYEADGRRVTIADRWEGKRLNSPNDIVVDDRGRAWFTDPRYGDRASMELDHDSIYRADPQPNGSWSLARVTFDTTRPNGLAFSPDFRILYVAESPPAPNGVRQLRAYPVNADGTLGQYRVLQDFGPNRGIDGMRVDAHGYIVAACGWEEGGPGTRIGVFAPTGEVVAEHPTPARPTNCCFGDDDLHTLYVTGFDGAVYRARTDRQGARRP